MRNRMMRRKKRRQRRKLICRILITVVSILTSVVIVIGCIWFYLISGIKKTDVISNETGFSTADETLEGETGTILMKKNYSNEKDIFTGMKNTGDTQEITEDENVYNILLFGLDRRSPSANSRTDSIILVSIDMKNKKMKETSIMRDLYLPIPGRNANRINGAFTIGGPALTIKALNTSFKLNIKNYIAVDYFGLEKVIDRIGGIDINIKDYELKYLNIHLSSLNDMIGNSVKMIQKPGLQHLNGRQAVAYCRIRYAGNADYERTERQRDVLDKIYKKIRVQGIFKFPGIINAILPSVETNLTNVQITEFAFKIFNCDKDTLEQFRIPVDGTFTSQKIRGMAVLVPDIAENKKRLHKFIYGNN